MTRRIVSLLVGALLSIVVVAPVLAAPTFTDVPETNIFHDDIQWLAAMEITKGCNPPINDRFCPTDFVTRGQMAAFLVRGLGLTDIEGSGDFFTDDDTSIFETDIDKLYTAGITSGCNPPANDHYCPNANVTRGQMAAFLVRGLGLTDVGTGGDYFTDDDTSIFETDIDKLYAAGITSGCNPPANDHYCPTAYVTREQMAAFLRRGLDTAPGQVTNVSATTAGGSGEIAVYWAELAEGDVEDYNVWYSEFPGGTKTLIADPFFGPEPTTMDRWYIIDWPRSLIVGRDCYQISGVDLGGNEGPRSAEACFSP